MSSEHRAKIEIIAYCPACKEQYVWEQYPLEQIHCNCGEVFNIDHDSLKEALETLEYCRGVHVINNTESTWTRLEDLVRVYRKKLVNFHDIEWTEQGKSERAVHLLYEFLSKVPSGTFLKQNYSHSELEALEEEP